MSNHPRCCSLPGLFLSSLVLAGCSLSIPGAVRSRPAFTGFDPTGAWFIEGVRPNGSTYRDTAQVKVIGQWLIVERAGYPHGVFGLADEERVYLASGKGARLHVLSEMDDGWAGMCGHPGDQGLGYHAATSYNLDSPYRRGMGFGSRAAWRSTTVTPKGVEDTGTLDLIAAKEPKAAALPSLKRSAWVFEGPKGGRRGVGLILGGKAERVVAASVPTAISKTTESGARGVSVGVMSKTITRTTKFKDGEVRLIALERQGEQLVGDWVLARTRDRQTNTFLSSRETWSRTPPSPASVAPAGDIEEGDEAAPEPPVGSPTE